MLSQQSPDWLFTLISPKSWNMKAEQLWWFLLYIQETCLKIAKLACFEQCNSGSTECHWENDLGNKIQAQFVYLGSISYCVRQQHPIKFPKRGSKILTFIKTDVQSSMKYRKGWERNSSANLFHTWLKTQTASVIRYLILCQVAYLILSFVNAQKIREQNINLLNYFNIRIISQAGHL